MGTIRAEEHVLLRRPLTKPMLLLAVHVSLCRASNVLETWQAARNRWRLEEI